MAEPMILTMCVPAEHPVFQGHFPGNPIVPGVMLLEWVLREAAHSLGRTPCALRVRETKFFTPLAPTQRAELVWELGGRRCTFDISCGSTRIARGILEWDADG